MKFDIVGRDISYAINGTNILKNFSFSVSKGAFVAVLGENGAGKTTLVDLIMGFRKSVSGSLDVLGVDAGKDPWQTRSRIAYLSERVDMPGDWTAKSFLDFNSFFYKATYDAERERRLIEVFRVDLSRRFSMMSAGEVRRVQIVAALAAAPELILVDEITAVLDIVGRHRFMAELSSANRSSLATVFLATNILEDITENATHVLLIKNGECQRFQTMTEFLSGQSSASFSELVTQELDRR